MGKLPINLNDSIDIDYTIIMDFITFVFFSFLSILTSVKLLDTPTLLYYTLNLLLKLYFLINYRSIF